MRALLRLSSGLVRDEAGQDLVEYALLASIIGIAGILAFPVIETKLTNAFLNWGVGVNDLWQPNPPEP